MQTKAIHDDPVLLGESLRSEVFAGEIVAGVVDRGEHILLGAGVPQATLDRVAVRLAALRSRVLRPSGVGSLTLPALLAQVVGRPRGETLDAADLERGFELLADAGPDCDRVVLLLDRAASLDPPALRYAQMLMQDGPLRLLFVGSPKFYATLMQDEFGALRRGFIKYGAESPAVARPPSFAAFAGRAISRNRELV